jgi:hypothetical protein
MSKTRREVLNESRTKGIVAFASTATSVALGVALAWPVGIAAAVPAAFLSWRWWKHRTENGIRFKDCDRMVAVI